MTALTGAQSQEKGKSVEKAPTVAQLEAQVRKLEADLAACKQVSAAYQEAAKADLDAVTIAKQRDTAEEEVRKLQKQVSTLQSDIQKARAGQAPQPVPAPPTDEMVTAASFNQLQGTLSQVQGQVTDLQGRAQRLQSENQSLTGALRKAQEDLDVARTQIQDLMGTVNGLHQDVEAKAKLIQEQVQAFDDLTKVHKETKSVLANTQAVLGKTQEDLKVMTGRKEHFQAIAENRLPGALVHLTDAIIPAKPLNLYSLKPPKREGLTNKLKGVIVVSCWVDVAGKVKKARLVQPLTGSSPDVQDVNKAYLELATELLFEPATLSDGKTRVQVWQGVGFLVDE